MSREELTARIDLAFDRFEAGESITAAWEVAAKELHEWPSRSPASLRATAASKRGISLSNGRPTNAVPPPERSIPRPPAAAPSALTLRALLEWLEISLEDPVELESFDREGSSFAAVVDHLHRIRIERIAT